MQGLAAAQRNYDRQLPEDSASYFREDEVKVVFNENIDVPKFILDLAQCGHNPAKWLYDNNVKDQWDETVGDVAEFLQSLSITYAAGHLTMSGSDRFWKLMVRMTLDRLEGGAA